MDTRDVGYPPPRRRAGTWLVLLAIVALVVIIVLLLTQCGADDDDGGSGTQTPVPTDTTAAGDTGGAAGGAGGGAGTLVAEGEDVFAAAEDGTLVGLSGSEVRGEGLQVVSVVGDAGYWVSAGEGGTPVFVEVEAEGGLGRQAQVGDVVSFTGAIEDNLEAEAYGLQGEEADRYEEQGAHVRVQQGNVQIE